MFNRSNALTGAALAALGVSASINTRKIYGAENIKRHIEVAKRDRTRDAQTSIATANRWTGEPHEHRRAIARHLRQRERLQHV